MISNKFLFDKANQNIGLGAALPELNITQLSSLATTTSGSLLTVATLAALPNVAQNLGRLVYVVAENKYYYSDGVTWNINYSSEYTPNYVAYAWGFNGNGRLGDNTTTDRSSPVSAVGGITNWSQLFAGRNHSLGVTTTGIAYAWGSNGEGRLGDGTITDRSSPVTVIGSITNWSQLAGGGFHSLGVTTTGIAYAWGLNSAGRLGDGTTTDRSSPVTVVGGITNWSQVSAGFSHSLGLTSTGIAYGWGTNNFGQLADGTETSRSSPVTVVGGITNWSQVSAGSSHSLGLTSTGIAYAWGLNSFGRLGDGTTTNRSSPVTVVGGITNWSQLSGGSHSLGLTSTGIAYAWGQGSAGQLGDGTTALSRTSPVTVIGGITNWSQVSAGTEHSLGLTSTGIAYAWGDNTNGRLGDGTTTSRLSPVTVIGGITNWSQLSSVGTHSLALALVPKGF